MDYVVMDDTNLPVLDTFSDAIELRPFEVLAEEWATLRAHGTPTPDIAIWQAIPVGATIQQGFLDVYNDPRFDHLIMRDRLTDKKVFFYVDPPDMPRWPDPSIMAAIESNGGRNNIILVPMWAYSDHVGGDPWTRGVWQFMAACVKNGGLSTAVGDAPCSQAFAANTVLRSVVSVSPSYQLGFASRAWSAPGKRLGLTLRKQFETALVNQPDYVFLSSWNEHIAQPGDMCAGIHSMGLEQDTTAGTMGFVDTYGSDFSRDMEPTVEAGSAAYDLMSSCVRVYRTGATSCGNPAELCCQGGNATDVYVFAHSVMYGDNTTSGTGHVVVTSQPEVDALVAQGWREICDPSGINGDFCGDPSETDPNAGPFMMYAQPGANRVPLYRCQLEPRHYFLTPDANCEILNTPGSQLGYVSTVRGGDSLRALTRCFSTTFAHTYTLTGTCTASNPEAVLGYVH